MLQLTHDELPFSTAVVVDKFDEAATTERVDLYCTILVDRESQKPIVIGKGGAMIKADRHRRAGELEHYLEKHVYLDLHVKVATPGARAPPKGRACVSCARGSRSSRAIPRPSRCW